MEEIKFAKGSVPVRVAARVYGRDSAWVCAGEGLNLLHFLKKHLHALRPICSVLTIFPAICRTPNITLSEYSDSGVARVVLTVLL